MADQLMAFSDACHELGVTADELHDQIARGDIRAFRDKGVLFCYESDVLALKAELAEPRERTGQEALTFAEALNELQMATSELRALAASGQIRTFGDEEDLRFSRTDVLGLSDAQKQS